MKLYFRFQLGSRALSVLVLLLAAAGGQAAPIGSLTQGPPAHEGKALPSSAYVEVEARQLKQAKVVWVNWDWLRSHGIEFPAEGLTPEFEKAALDALAWAIPDPAGGEGEARLFGAKKKKFKADRYGGIGIDHNLGSGRAASAGQVQIKGIGKTPLVQQGSNFVHGHGRATLEEAFREAIWGEVANHELPHGANRVIAILDSGTSTNWPDGRRDRNALIIREDPVRPAHFLPPVIADEGEKAKTLARVRGGLPNLRQALPGSDLYSGFETYVERLADQFATAYANRFYHGATSESNIELSGKFLDFGTMTAQPGHGDIQLLSWNPPAIQAGAGARTLLAESFVAKLREMAPPELVRQLPDAKSMGQAFEQRYGMRLREQMLELTGLPPALAAQLEKTPQGEELARILIALAQLSPETWEPGAPINVKESMPEETGKYALRKLFPKLTQAANPREPREVEALLKTEIAQPKLRKSLAQAYSAAMTVALREVWSNGVPPDALLRYMAKSAQLRNGDISDLYRPQLRAANYEQVDEYLRTGDRELLARTIDTHIQESLRKFADPAPFELVLREFRDPLSGRVEQLQYDARQDRHSTRLSYLVHDGAVDFHGSRIPLKELEGARLRYSGDQGKTWHEVGPTRVGDRVEFVLAQVQAPEFALRSADSSRWWKNGEKSFRIAFRPWDGGCGERFRDISVKKAR